VSTGPRPLSRHVLLWQHDEGCVQVVAKVLLGDITHIGVVIATLGVRVPIAP
jgi:hypothetical protein